MEDDITELLHENQDTDENRAELLKAIENGDRSNVEALIALGVSCNFKHDNGKTPLVTAIHSQNKEMIEAVLMSSNEINVNQKDEVGQTPLLIACKLALTNNKKTRPDYIKLITRLLEFKNIDINARDDGGSNSLMFVVAAKDYELASLLLAKGADVNATNSNVGNAPLHLAVINKDKKMIELLVQYGARASLADSSGQTPKQLADAAKELTGDEQIKKYLSGVSPPPHVEWVSLQKYRPGIRRPQLGITTIGKVDEFQSWVERDAKILVQNRCSVLVTAISAEELNEMELNNLFEILPTYNIQSIHFPIHKWIPRFPMEDLVNFTETILQKIKEGQVVIIHTDQGQGRAGLLSAAILIRLGYSQDEAVQIINAINPLMLQNPVYHIYLTSFTTAVNDKKEEEFNKIENIISSSIEKEQKEKELDPMNPLLLLPTVAYTENRGDAFAGMFI